MDIVFIACVAALTALAVGLVALLTRRRRQTLPLVARDVLSPRERECHRLLMMQYPGHHIFPQYALSQLLAVQAGAVNPQSVRNQFSQLVADFVLCRADYSVVAVIELDDGTHVGWEQRERDARKDRAVRSAGLRLVRIPSGPLPPGPELRRLVDADGATAGKLSGPPLGVTKPSRALLGASATALMVIGGAALYWSLRESPEKNRNVAASALHKPAAAVQAKPHPQSEPKPRPEPASVPVPVPLTVSPSSGPTEALPVQDSNPGSEMRVLEAKNKKKENAWAAYYKPYPSCEHPVSWEEQVECGNRYIRARREFDKQWEATHAAGR